MPQLRTPRERARTLTDAVTLDCATDEDRDTIESKLRIALRAQGIELLDAIIDLTYRMENASLRVEITRLRDELNL